MPGPAPKSAATRARRNRVSGAATLVVRRRRVRTPKLDEAREWHAMTVAWWKELWRSPMAEEYLPSDVYGLLMLAELVENFWGLDGRRKRAQRALADDELEAETVVELMGQLNKLDERQLKLLAEIRMQGALFGTTPIDRRRLQWEVQKVEGEPMKAGRGRVGPQAAADPAADPRQALRVLVS